MGSFGRYLVHSLLAVLGGLPLGCLAGGVGLAAYSWATESWSIEHLLEAAGLSLLTSLAAVFVGILPAFVYGAPLYALLSRFGLANWGTAAVLGALPGAVLLLTREPLGWLVLAFGSSVALSTHWIARRRMRGLASQAANNSSKPTPLRSAA
ncbi:hypothetical protein GCM10027188_29210 [Lysobacter humi (ex Lee et al. 2017)]